MPERTMDFHTLDRLRRDHPAWRLLGAQHAPLIVSVLDRYFVEPNVRTMPRAELVARVEDDLFRLREELGDDVFPRPAAHYLDEWASDDKGWLRKYYPAGTDEPHYDITPATEKVIGWLAGLQERHFIGTESRLLTVFELLRQMMEGTELDPEARIAELEKRRAEIDAEIGKIRGGQLDIMDPTQVKERFLQMAATARGLLADFRDVEQNFRELDRSVRERIAVWDESRGALLDSIFDERDAIENSDQGKSFNAFWDFLMSPDRQEELTALLRSVMELDAVRSLSPPADPRLARIHYDWLEAGEVAQRTVARLSQQLRRYLDDQAWLENRRIMQLIRSIEQHALAIRHDFPAGPEMAIDEAAPDIDLPMERPLFSPAFKPVLGGDVVLAGDEDIPADALFEQVYVDREQLRSNVRRMLQSRDQVSLVDVIDEHPLERGLAELVGYLSIAADDGNALMDEKRRETVGWTDDAGVARRATLPVVVFVRPVENSVDAAATMVS
jgi:hypothetical protein